MTAIKIFVLNDCPYCAEALSLIDELKKENKKYAEIKLELTDEDKCSDVAALFDYFFVPAMYSGDPEHSEDPNFWVKLHEGIPTKEKIRKALDKALSLSGEAKSPVKQKGLV